MGTVYFIAVGLGAFWIFPSASPDAIVCATLISSQIEVSCPLQYIVIADLDLVGKGGGDEKEGQQ